jgi:hypothetical protein
MLQAGLGSDLPLKPLHAQRRPQRRMQHLERDPPPVAEVLGQVHRGARPPAELLLDQVVVGQLRREAVLRVG